MCCGLFFGTESTQGNCLLSTPITANSLAYPYFPYSAPPVADKKKQIYARIYSHAAYTQTIEFIVYVSAPLVSGAFPSTPTLLTQFALTAGWVAGGPGVYKQGSFAFTPTASQVTNGVCFLIKANPMGLTGCVCPTGFGSNIFVDPLCAVYDRPW